MSFGSYSTFEYIALINRSEYPCLVFTVYHPPRLKKAFLSEFCEHLSNISVEYNSTAVISGDFNTQTDNTTDHFPNQFTDMLSAFEFRVTLLIWLYLKSLI